MSIKLIYSVTQMYDFSKSLTTGCTLYILHECREDGCIRCRLQLPMDKMADWCFGLRSPPQTHTRQPLPFHPDWPPTVLLPNARSYNQQTQAGFTSLTKSQTCRRPSPSHWVSSASKVYEYIHRSVRSGTKKRQPQVQCGCVSCMCFTNGNQS